MWEPVIQNIFNLLIQAININSVINIGWIIILVVEMEFIIYIKISTKFIPYGL